MWLAKKLPEMAVKWPTNNVVSIFVDKTIVLNSNRYVSEKNNTENFRLK